MGLDKYSFQADAVANLYRAAFYLAKGSRKIGLEFLRRAKEKIGEKLAPQIIQMSDYPQDYLKDSQDQSYWAEKILDQYIKLKSL